MPKRILTEIRLDKIAAVDQPCQEHATVAIVKRAPGAGTPKAIAKATFGEALQGNMIAGEVNEAFFDSFDGLWARNDAFREALTDELAAGGDGTTASAAYVASVKALVDEAVAAAREAGTTAVDTSAVEKSLTTAAEKWLAAKSQPKEPVMKISTRAELLSAVAKFNPETSPAAHIGIIQKAATDLGAEDALPAEGLLAKAAPASDPTLVRKVAILEMPADVRKHFDGLPAAEQDAFLKLSPEKRAEDVAKRNEGDPVVFTTGDGIEIRKSDGRTAELLARQNDRLNKRVDQLEGDVASSTLQKRASAFANVAEPVAIDLLKAIDAAGGEGTDIGKSLKAGLDRMNKAGGRLFKSIGSSEGGDEPVGDEAAKAEFNQAVDKAANEGKLARADAMSKVRRDQPALFKRAFPEACEPEDEDA